MCWTKHKKTKNAIGLHISFELNQMIPTEFITTAANHSERSFLGSIVQKGITYIADRGYFSFDLGAKIIDAKAFLIFRIKANLIFTVSESLSITSRTGLLPACFSQVKDQLIRFENDSHLKVYRLISFVVLESKFIICTHRLKLTTLEIIMLYAYRWQVELLFKFIKRILNGIHLFNLSQNGVSIHFYALMITALLQLRLRQTCLELAQLIHTTKCMDQKEGLNLNEMELFSSYKGYEPATWIKNITDKFYTYWRIGLHWLIKLKNLLAQPFDIKAIRSLGVP